MSFLVALAAAAVQFASSTQVGINQPSVTMTGGNPATFDLAGFRLGMSEANVEQLIKSRRLRVVRVGRVNSFEDRVRGLLRVRSERAPTKGGSVLGQVELDDGQGGRIYITMLSWPDAAHVSSITFLPPRGTEVAEWKSMLVSKYGPAADGGGRIDTNGFHASWCGKSTCSGGIGVFMLTADVSAAGGAIHLRQPENTPSRVKALVAAEADRRTSKRTPKF